MNEFYDRYIDFKKEDLFQVILSSSDYQPEAVEAVRQIIKEKHWEAELKKAQDEQKIKDEIAQEKYDQDITEKAEYFKKAVEFQEQRNSFEVRIADTPKFEGALTENNIEFFREDKNIGVQLDSYPTQTYYFKNEDVERVDEITNELHLITAPYADIKPFFRFEVKVILIVLIIAIVTILIFK